MQFSLEQLSTFVAVYEHHSFSKAAATLNRHRTTVGQVIANLEDQLAVELFIRNSRTVKPTAEGDLLFKYAKQTVEQAKEFDQVALTLSYGELEAITIAYNGVLPLSALTHIRQSLAKAHPSLSVNFVAKNQQQVRQGLIDGTIHFGIVMVNRAIGISNIEYHLLGNLSLAPYCSPNSALNQLAADEIYPKLKIARQLIHLSLIEEGLGELIQLSANSEVYDNSLLIKQLISADIGWGLLPNFGGRNESEGPQLTKLNCEKVGKGISVPISLWNLQSQPVLKLKPCVLNSINQFIRTI